MVGMTTPGFPRPDTATHTAVDAPRAVRHGSRGSAILLGCAAGLLGVLLTIGASWWLGELDREQQLNSQVREVERMTAALNSRLEDYRAFARTVAGLFAASEEVTGEEWSRFVSTSGLSQLIERGAFGVVYAPRVDPGQHIEWAERFAEATGRPIGVGTERQDVAFPVQYFAPDYSPLGAAIGRDLLTGTAERDAVTLAMATKRAVLSAPTRFGRVGVENAGAVMVMPVENRVARLGITAHSLSRLEGVVGVVVDYRDWTSSVLAQWSNTYAIELSDPSVGSGEPLMSVPAGYPQIGPIQYVNVANRRLSLRFFSLERRGYQLVETTAMGAGLLLSAGLAWLTYFLLAGRYRAESKVVRVSEELADSERRFALALSATSDGVWEWMPGRQTIFLSAHGHKILFGTTVADGQVSARRVLRQFPVAERGVVLTAIRAHHKQRTLLDVELTMQGAAGRTHYLRVRGQAQWDDLGRVIRLAGAVSDVTDLRRREIDLERTQQFYARVLEILPHPLIIKTRDRRYLMWNEAACELVGMPRERLLGGTTHDVLPDQAGDHDAMDDEVIATGRNVSREFHMRFESTREVDVIVSKAAVPGLDGEPVILTMLSNVTALRRAESALRASLSELDGLFRNSPLGMAMVTKQGVIRRANAAFSRIVGLGEAELIGRTYQELTPARLHQLDREKTIDALRSDAVTPYERAFRRPDGSEVPVVLSGAVVRGNDGEAGVWTVVEDISERKAAEEALRLLNATNKSMVDALPDMLVQFDANLNFVAFHCGNAESLRFQPETVMGKPLREILSKKRYDVFEPLFVKAMAERKVELLEYSAPNGRDEMQHYEARIAPISTGGALVVLRNTTERQRREAALRESESRFRLMADAAPVIIWVGDEEMGVTYFNRRWYDITGARDDGPSANWVAYVHPDDAERVIQIVDHARDKRQAFELECRIRRQDGTYLWLMVVGALRYADSGEFAGFIGCGTDVTEVRQAHQELRRHRDHLAELVSAQTASVLSAKEAAERASEAKSAFLANMSHELRSPMHAVLSYARLGEDKCGRVPIEKTVDYFQRIRTSGERLLVLLNDLLDLAKLEARRMTLERKPVLLQELVADIAKEQEGLCIARQLLLVREVGGKVPAVFVDPVRMGQVVRNLISNAIKFSPHGGQIVLCVSLDHLRAGRRAGDMQEVPAVSLIVSDEGPGVPVDELKTVFDKFVQSSKTSNGAGGTGLGLAICKEIVDAHGGTIHVENGESGGARFVVVLPLNAGHAPADNPNNTEEHFK